MTIGGDVPPDRARKRNSGAVSDSRANAPVSRRLLVQKEGLAQRLENTRVVVDQVLGHKVGRQGGTDGLGDVNGVAVRNEAQWAASYPTKERTRPGHHDQ